MILLDTDHCVFFIRGRDDVVRAFHDHASDEPAISILSVGDLYFGALRSARPAANLGRAREFIQRVSIINLDEDVMVRFAEIKAELSGRGAIIEDPDLLIAATALVHGVCLVTHNRSHFERVPGLRLEDWCT